MSAYSNQSIILNGEAQDLDASGAAIVAEPISEILNISALDARELDIWFECSSVAGTVTFQIQECHRKDGTFVDTGDTVNAANGVVNINVNRALGTTRALKPFIRIVADAANAVNDVLVSRIYASRRV